MRAESGGSVEEPGKELGSVQQEARTCPVCGMKIFAAVDGGLCPVCLLRGAIGGGAGVAGGPCFIFGAPAGPRGDQGRAEGGRLRKYYVLCCIAGGTPLRCGCRLRA